MDPNKHTPLRHVCQHTDTAGVDRRRRSGVLCRSVRRCSGDGATIGRSLTQPRVAGTRKQVCCRRVASHTTTETAMTDREQTGDKGPQHQLPQIHEQSIQATYFSSTQYPSQSYNSSTKYDATQTKYGEAERTFVKSKLILFHFN